MLGMQGVLFRAIMTHFRDPFKIQKEPTLHIL